MRRFVEHRVGDPRILNLIRRWLTVGVLEDGEVHTSTEGTPQGGAISVLLSNVYLHYVLDLGFEKAIKPRLDGEAYLIRYIDDFVVCFQHQRDAERFQAVLSPRLHKFPLDLEPTKTRRIAFGRFAQRDAQAQGRKKPDTLYFLGFTHYCTRNRHGGFMVGRKTEKSRVRRTIQRLQATMRQIRHDRLEDQVHTINQLLPGHYAYFGMAGNLPSLQQVYRVATRYWRRMLSRRSQKSTVGPCFQGFLRAYPSGVRSGTFPMRTYNATRFCEPIAEEPSAGNPHAGFRGGWAARDLNGGEILAPRKTIATEPRLVSTRTGSPGRM